MGAQNLIQACNKIFEVAFSFIPNPEACDNGSMVQYSGFGNKREPFLCTLLLICSCTKFKPMRSWDTVHFTNQLNKSGNNFDRYFLSCFSGDAIFKTFKTGELSKLASKSYFCKYDECFARGILQGSVQLTTSQEFDWYATTLIMNYNTMVKGTLMLLVKDLDLI